MTLESSGPMNSGVAGTLSIIGIGSPAGYIFEVWERWLGVRFLGTTTTDAGGAYAVNYPPNIIGTRDLTIRVYDPVYRLLDEQGADNIADTIYAHDVSISAGTADGWIPALGIMLSQGNQIAVLTDNHDAWSKLCDDVIAAATKIHLSQLQWELDYMFEQFAPDPPAIGTPTNGDRLEVLLQTATVTADVRVVMNDFNGVAYPADTFDRVRDFFAGSKVQVVGFPRPLREGPMHAKIAVVDQQGYSIGSPLLQEYFDASSHSVRDARRGEMTWPFNAIRVPVHDVSARVTGPVVAYIDFVFETLWQLGAVLPPVPNPPFAPGATAIQVALTVPGNLLPSDPNGFTHIFEAYQRAFRYAGDFIYLENQYLTEPLIIDSLIRALRLNLDLQVIMLLNPKVDLPFYQKWQENLVANFLAALSPAEQLRVGIFTLWTHEINAGVSTIMRNYIHSKVAIVDTLWATVGSANLDGPSLTRSQYILPPLSSADLVKRSIEANLIVYSDVAGLPASPFPDDLRRNLWAEHLGYASPNDPDLIYSNRPAGGWLDLWNRVAFRKFNSIQLGAGPPTVDPARILAWPTAQAGLSTARGRSFDEQFLQRMGLSLSQHTVLPEVQSFDFQTGNWL
jgi:phosphatidylserine/phosphatidylglycerophosphate/cardiolipin synthase-like enzyme